MSKHASVTVGGYVIPLIGIAPDETLEECDLCHDMFDILQIRWSGKQMLCDKCNDNKPNKDHRIDCNINYHKS